LEKGMTDCLDYKGNTFYFHTGERQTARELVLKYHYSGRCHENPILVGSLHFGGGGLYGDKGELVATCIFSLSNNNTWSLKKVDLIELVRLCRKEEVQVPLSWLVSRTVKEVKRLGRFDIAISYADATQDHHGGIYQACSWNFHTYRQPKEDGLIIDGKFVPKRSVSTRYGTYRRDKLGEMFDEVKQETLYGTEVKTIEWGSHVDKGKYMYWIPLNKTGKKIAKRVLNFETNEYPKPKLS
jgi:hypothetical protein